MKQGTQPGSKGGYTIQELEDMWQKYVVEIGVGVVFVLTAIFSLIIGGWMVVWSILLSMIFGIVSVVFPDTSKKITGKSLGFINGLEKVTLIVTFVLAAIVAIFLPCVIFAMVGFVAGHSIHYDAYGKTPPMVAPRSNSKKKSKKTTDHPSSGQDHHDDGPQANAQ